MHFLHEVRVGMSYRGERYWSDYELSGNTRAEESVCHQKGERTVHIRAYALKMTGRHITLSSTFSHKASATRDEINIKIEFAMKNFIIPFALMALMTACGGNHRHSRRREDDVVSPLAPRG